MNGSCLIFFAPTHDFSRPFSIRPLFHFHRIVEGPHQISSISLRHQVVTVPQLHHFERRTVVRSADSRLANDYAEVFVVQVQMMQRGITAQHFANRAVTFISNPILIQKEIEASIASQIEAQPWSAMRHHPRPKPLNFSSPQRAARAALSRPRRLSSSRRPRVVFVRSGPHRRPNRRQTCCGPHSCTAFAKKSWSIALALLQTHLGRRSGCCRGLGFAVNRCARLRRAAQLLHCHFVVAHLQGVK
eukprot:Selendium_serpulae@DN8117_c0_g1_i1.p1